jgi:hypothetical protein
VKVPLTLNPQEVSEGLLAKYSKVQLLNGKVHVMVLVEITKKD